MEILSELRKHKRRFIQRVILLFGGTSSALGLIGEYHRRFGWRLEFDRYFALRALILVLLWTVIAYILAIVAWSRIERFVERFHETSSK